MGTWGTAIFSNDLASDIRSEFKDHIGNGLTPEEATSALLEEYRSDLDDPDEAPAFWLGLAATQWKLGRLLPSVCARALAIIDSGEDLLRWEEDQKLIAKRKVVLLKLREQLVAQMPLPKRIPKRFLNTTDWRKGEVIQYRASDDSIHYLHVIGLHTDRGGTAPVVQVLDWRFDGTPNQSELEGLPVRIFKWDTKKFLIFTKGRRDYPSERVHKLGIILKTNKRTVPCNCAFWDRFDEELRT